MDEKTVAPNYTQCQYQNEQVDDNKSRLCITYSVIADELHNTGDILADTTKDDHCANNNVGFVNASGMHVRERDQEEARGKRREAQRHRIGNNARRIWHNDLVTRRDGDLSLKIGRLGDGVERGRRHFVAR